MNRVGHGLAGFAARLALSLLLLAFLALAASAAGAGADTLPRYNSRLWQIDEGLPDNVVQAIAQTPDGYLWVGTRSGLARFDGVSFTPFESKAMPELKHSSISDLCVDGQGALWVATDSSGLACLSNGALRHYDKSSGLAGNILTALQAGADGSIWLGSTVGVSRFKDGKFTHFNSSNGLFSDLINAIYCDSEGTVWVATAEGLNFWKNGVMEKFGMISSGPHHSMRAVCREKSGRLWVGSNSGITSCRGGEVCTYDTACGLSDVFISALHEDSEGNLWVGTYSGLNCFRAGRFVTELNSQGAPYDKVNTIFQDREGNLWLGSREGLVRLGPKHFFTYTKQQGLTHDNIMSVLEDHNGNIWVGTWGGGLDQLHDDKVGAYTTSNGFPHDLILSLCETRDGALWVGADYDGGLIRFKDGHCTRYTGKDGMINASVRVIYEDRAGILWVGTTRGLSCFKDGKFTNYTTEQNLPYNIIRAICEDQAGNLWIGTESGLSRWRNGQITNFYITNGLADDAVLALYEDREQNLWIGTASGGLNRLRDGRFTAYTSQQGLFNDEILSILDDERGWLWMSSPRGIFRVRKRDLDDFDRGMLKSIPCVSYGKLDGMESILCNGVSQPSGWRSHDGRLWFPTTKGLVVVLSEPQINECLPTVYVKEFSADNHRVVLDVPAASPGGQSPAQGRSDDSHPLQIPPGRGELEFHYTALSLTAAEKNRFAYMLEGVDRKWVDAGFRRNASYYNIYPGTYHFLVKACNNDGVWNDTGASLAFVLLPHFWQTWWFRTTVVLLAVGTIGGTVRYFSTRHLRQRVALLEMQHSVERDRARIARDIHDDLGSTLTQITFVSELIQRDSGQPAQVNRHAVEIAQTARELVQAMDEIVWAINPRNDNLPRLAGYLCQYAEKLFSGTPIRCRFDTQENLPRQNLSSETRHHLFLTVKEALHNAARHAAASEVWLRIKQCDSELQVSIEDNGRGFGPDSVRQFGNGLDNMKKRMEEIGGAFEMTTAPGAGTAIRLRLSLKR